MMKLFAVRDVKSDSFTAPFSVVTRGIALRAFSDACADERSDFAKYPEDYTLYEIGSYDPNSGMVTALPLPLIVASAYSVCEQLKIARSTPAAARVIEVAK